MQHRIRPSRARWRWAGAIATVVVVSATALTGGAPAAEIPPAPTVAPSIFVGPNTATTRTVASFRYAHPQLGVTFECSLDAAAFTSCAAIGVNYTSLGEGLHTFRVAARNGASDRGPLATRTWTVDRAAPSVTVAGPDGAAAFNAATWASACAGAGAVCGTASDPVGVSGVLVAVLRVGTNRYWTGTAFTATTAQYLAASGTTAWRLGLTVPPDGGITVLVRARDALGNQTALAAPFSATVLVDTVVPATPVLSAVPEPVTTAASADVAFRLPAVVAGGPSPDRNDANAVAECALDGAAFGPCTSPVPLRSLAAVDHCFAVRAVSRSLLVSSPATRCWSVVLDRGFTVTGEVTGPMAPGVSRTVDLRLSNPYPADLTVLTVTITVSPTTSNVGCAGNVNLAASRDLVGPVRVPANSTRTLSALGISESRWPVVTMPNLDTNQDACKNAVFHLTYQGTASTS